MASVTISISTIPLYLQSGEFFRILSKDNPEEPIEVPANCFHPDGNYARNLTEFRQILGTMVFWMLDEVPPAVLDFCGRNEIAVWRDAISELTEAVADELLPVLNVAYSKQDGVPLKSIILLGRREIFEHAIRRMSKDGIATVIAAETGNLIFMGRLFEEKFPWHKDACCQASKFNQLDCLKFAHENGCPWDVRVYEFAAEQGHLRCMEYADQEQLPWHSSVCAIAARSGQLECLQFAHSHGCPWDSSCVINAAEFGHSECVRFLLDHGCAYDEKACFLAARNGHVSVLDILQFDYGRPWSVQTSHHAAECPDSACLHNLILHNCPWDKETLVRAALSGNVETLRLALEYDCPHDDKLMLRVVEAGLLHVLQFMVERQGISFHDETFICALTRGDMEIVRYLVDHECPFRDATFPLGKWRDVFYSNCVSALAHARANLTLWNSCVFLWLCSVGKWTKLRVFVEVLVFIFKDDQLDMYRNTMKGLEHVKCVEFAIECGWHPDYRVIRRKGWFIIDWRSWLQYVHSFYTSSFEPISWSNCLKPYFPHAQQYMSLSWICKDRNVIIGFMMWDVVIHIVMFFYRPINWFGRCIYKCIVVCLSLFMPKRLPVTCD